MSIFRLNNYRKCLRLLMDEKKKLNSQLSYQNMALYMKVQKAYLSKVINERGDLNQDQLYLAAQYLNCDKSTAEYLSLLLELERSSLATRKKELTQKVEAFQEKMLKTSAHLDAKKIITQDTYREYFLNPYLQLVHNCLSIPQYKGHPANIAKDLQISSSQLEDCFSTLERLKFIQQQGNKYTVLVENIHLPAESEFTPLNHFLMRVLSAQKIRSQKRDSGFHLSVTFTASMETKKKIQMVFLDSLKKIEKDVQEAPSEELFQMNLDLFQWNEK